MLIPEEVKQQLPPELPVVALRDYVIFPMMLTPLDVGPPEEHSGGRCGGYRLADVHHRHAEG